MSYDKTMQAGSAMHTTLLALAKGHNTAGGIAEALGGSTKHIFGYLQLHERRGNIRSRRVTRGQTVRVLWAFRKRGLASMAGAQ